MNKKYYRCIVCKDVHYGLMPPEKCPTCQQMNVYVEIEKKEALVVMQAKKGDDVKKEKQLKAEEVKKFWQALTERNKTFMLNPEPKIVDGVAEGVLMNEKKCGLKLCPCRLRDSTFERDRELICPCNFFTHETWNTQDRCWCGLFVKKR